MNVCMRRILLLTLIVFAIQALPAQITLTSADIGAPGTEYYMGTDTNVASVNIGPAGANQSWDFTMLGAAVADTIRFLDPTNTPYAADYPTSNLAIFQADLGGYAYLESDANSLELIGIAGDPLGLGETFVIEQVDPFRIAQFPLTYGDNFSDTSIIDARIEVTGIIPVGDSARYKTTAFRELEVDGWGNLELFAGSYNSLRVKEVTTTFDSIWVKLPFIGWSLFQDSSYVDSTFTWWNKTKGYLLCEASYSGGVLGNITYQDPNIVGATEPEDRAFAIYPNPGQDYVRIERKKAGPVQATLVDVNGKALFEEKLLNRVHELSLLELPNGLYFLRFTDTDGQLLDVERLSIQR